MNPLSFIVSAAACMAIILIDIATICLLLRLLAAWFPTGWTRALDTASRPLVDRMFNALDRLSMRHLGRKFRQQIKPFVCIVVLFAARTALSTLVVALAK